MSPDVNDERNVSGADAVEHLSFANDDDTYYEIVSHEVIITNNEHDSEDTIYEPDLNEEMLSSEENGAENQNYAKGSNGDIRCAEDENSTQDQEYIPNAIDEYLSNEDDEIENPPQTKRHRKRRRDKKTWACNINKFKRMKGLGYQGRGQSYDGKAVFNQPRAAREMLPPCNCKPSVLGKTFKCKNFTHENRRKIFDEFWGMSSWPERKQFVRGLVNVLPPVKRKSTEIESSRRNATLILNLKKDGVHNRVCQKMFLNTLAIGEWSLQNWTKSEPINDENDEPNQPMKTNPRSTDAKKMVRKFFDDLAKLDAHYSRLRTSKLYLEPIWQSKADLYREYKKFSLLENSETDMVSIKTFSMVFEELNLGLFLPKKDQYDVCANFKAKNLSEEEYSKHQKRKENARKEKDKIESSHVYCMDLQKVLLSPHSNVSSFYYKRKLCVHNFLSTT